MRLTTTTIGAYPKPDFLPIIDWFRAGAGPDAGDPTRDYEPALAGMGDRAEAVIGRAVKQVVAEQVEAGVDIPTDGEVRRENYIHYHCRHLDGMDFSVLTRKAARGGSYNADLPTITGPIRAQAPFLPDDWRLAQSFTERPVKITMPGPMTIADTTVDHHYGDEARLGADLAAALNVEARALAAAGCRHIQIDEPVFARKPDRALRFGIDHLERCFHGLPEGVTRTVHICCGYPDRLDREDYPKADPAAYHDLADAIDRSCVDAVSIEDAHRPNDLALLERFARTTVILGVVAIAKSRIEPVDEIRDRLNAALDHIDSQRLVAAPDCGLGLLSRELTRAKLANLCVASHDL